MTQKNKTKRFPLGSYTFAQIRDGNYLYADKTQYIYNLLNQQKEYFLSRPRRFGKTLFLHTLDELFSGNRERFKGLWIDKSDYGFPYHPVISLSMSLSSPTTAKLEENLTNKIIRVADKYNVKIDYFNDKFKDNLTTSYFGNLLIEVSKKFKKEVVVLIDEYDAPVTRNMSNFEVAESNANFLHDFFATLKDIDISPFIHFTFVTGITRYALTSMDSGPNHLNDISLDPEYSGICGFTLREFDSLFADRMEDTLSKLIKNGKMSESSNVSDLRAKILHWYNGYTWGGDTVLNPLSILKFFNNNAFDDYWIDSGRPSHLTALIRNRPLDFLNPRLEAYVSTEIRKTDIKQLSPGPVLFHSGYLTIDKITEIPVEDPSNQEMESKTSYSFKLPNFEVSSNYYKDCFNVIFDFENNKEPLAEKGKEIKKAFIERDADVISEILSGYFKTISYHQRPNDEKTFHSLTHMLLSGMGFTLLSEIPGYKGRLDLCVKIKDKLFLIIELKYCAYTKKLTKKEENKILANAAKSIFSSEEYKQILINAFINKLSTIEMNKILINASDKIVLSKDEENKILLKESLNTLKEQEINNALAIAIRTKLPIEEVEKTIIKNGSIFSLPEEQIDDNLSKAMEQALRDIKNRDYHSNINDNDSEIFDLALAIFSSGEKIKAKFAP